jgi:low temperature requirement protein LtrA
LTVDAPAPRADGARVSTLELFFDLVFVFTITQLTGVLAHDGLATGVPRTLLMLGLIFWMYGGYAWLTNAVTMDTALRRTLLLTGMAAYLVLALAIPHAFTERRDALVFGLAYLVIVSVHTGLFLNAVGGGRAGMRSLGPANLTTAGLVLAGGIAGGTVQVVLWVAAFLGEWLTPYVAGIESFTIDPGHFVERHGLVVIVAIGESVVAIGIGASGLPLTAEIVGIAVLGLLLSACLWWTYFAQDDRRAEEAMRAAPPPERGRMAIRGFGYCHLLLLLGIIAIAAGLEEAIAHPFDRLETDPAVVMAAGASLYLLGDVLFRRSLHLTATGPWRLLAAVLLLAAIPLGTAVSAVAELALLVAVFGGALLLEAER